MKKLALILVLCLMGFTQRENKILFVGDSLTCYRGGWQHQVARMLHVKHDNISKGGKRTDWMLKRLREHLRTNSEYDKAFIYGGINDAFSRRRNGVVISDIQAMVDLCNEKGIKPIVIVGYNPDKVNRNTMYSDEITKKGRDKYILTQITMEKQLINCQIIPMENSIDRTDSDDGIHLKASGHRKFAKWVIEML